MKDRRPDPEPNPPRRNVRRFPLPAEVEGPPSWADELDFDPRTSAEAREMMDRLHNQWLRELESDEPNWQRLEQVMRRLKELERLWVELRERDR
jgi:hypothetical protein